MKATIAAAAAAALALLSSAAAVSAQTAYPQAPQPAHKAEGTIWDQRLPKTLRQLVAEGYQIVAVVPQRPSPSLGDSVMYYLQKGGTAARCVENYAMRGFNNCTTLGD